MRGGRGTAVLLVSAAVLAYEVLLVRVFAIEQYHHFASMAIGVAMLGYGAAGTLLALAPPERARAGRWFARLAALAALALVLGPALAHRIPLDATQLAVDARQWLRLAEVSGVLAIAFGLCALTVLLALDLEVERPGALYGASFAGAALGAAAALGVLALAPPARAIALPAVLAAIGALAALRGAGPDRPARALAALAAVVAPAAFVAPPWPLRITPYKALPQVEAYPDARRVAELTSPLGWVVAIHAPAFRYAPGLSLAWRGAFPSQTALFVDGEIAGAVARSAGDAGQAMLDWLPAAAPYALGRMDRVLVIGAGSGVDLALARRHAPRVVALELHPALARLVRSGDAARGTANRVAWVVADARNYVAHTGERFDLITMGPGGVLGASAGLHALSEDFLHTVEAYRLMLARLTGGGVLAITRWLTVPPRAGTRVLLTAAAALRRSGLDSVAGRMAVVRSWGTTTVLVKPAGFSGAELAALRAWAASRNFDVDWPPGEGAAFNVLEGTDPAAAARASAAGPGSAASFAAHFPFDVEPATDARPYPDHFVRLRHLAAMLRRERGAWLPFAEWGPIALVATLLESVVLGGLLVLSPALAVGLRSRAGGRAGALVAYFAAIGVAYLTTELAAIQQLGLLLGHPVYAVAAALAAFLMFSGMGSLWSDRLDPRAARRAAAALAALLAVYAALLLGAVHLAQPAPLALRALAAVLLLAPPAFLMGLPFPLGLRGIARGTDRGLALAWAANGFASVVAAPLGALVALEAGSRALFLLAALGYAAAAALAPGLRAVPAPTASGSP